MSKIEVLHTIMLPMKQLLFLLTLSGFLLLGGCGPGETGITELSMLSGGKTFAVPTGTVADQFVLKRFPDAKIEYYNSVLDCALAVKGGKAEAAVYDEPVLKNIVAKNEGLMVLSELLFGDKYGFAVRMDSTSLKAAIDETLAELKSNGTYADMMKRWFPLRGSPAPMPEIGNSGSNGVLKFGTAAVTEPMSFFDANRNVVGFDIEFASYIALKLGRKLEIVDMEFGAMLPALISGKVDMIGAGLSITEERAKKVLFSESYYPSGIAAAVKGIAKAAPETVKKLKPGDDLNGKKIGVLIGSVYDKNAKEEFPTAKVLYYQNVSDILIALTTGKVDVTYYDEAATPEMLKSNPDVGILTRNIFAIPIGAGFNSENDGLREQFNLFLKEIRSNGIYQDMVSRWIEKGLQEMPEIKITNKTEGVLRAGVVNDLGMPFGLVKDGKIIGFDIELSSRFAAWLGREYEPVPLAFGSLIASISTNKIDIITASMFVTEEREKMIDFADPYYQSGVCLVALKSNIDESVSGAQEGMAAPKRSFLKRMADSFYSNMILENRYLLILDGLKLTILISIFSALFGTILGGLVCWMRMSKNNLLSGIARGYINLLRGTPVLVLLMIIYYIIFSSVNINPGVVSVIAFGLNFGAYVSEMFRTSIGSVDRGQKEAGIAAGFTKIQTFIHIITPQALKHLLPVYKGEFISLVKMTSIVGYIAVQDLTKASDIIRSRTFDAFFPLIMAAVIYLALAWLLTWALGYIEISVDPKRKRISKELEAAR